jgi:hypothetical protein
MSFKGVIEMPLTCLKRDEFLEDYVELASQAMLEDRLTRLPIYMSGPKKKGDTFYDLTPEETAECRAAFLPIHQQWIETLEKKGKPARKVYEKRPA